MTADTSKTKFTLRHNILKRYFAEPITVALAGTGTYVLYTHNLGWVPNVFVEYTTDAGRKRLVSDMQFLNSSFSPLGDINGEVQVDSTTVRFKQTSAVSRDCIFHIKVYVDE